MTETSATLSRLSRLSRQALSPWRIRKIGETRVWRSLSRLSRPN